MSFINSAAKTIFDSIQTGYYVAMSDILDEHISSTTDLTDGEANVWRYLYRRARFNTDLCCTETREQIAISTRKQKSSVPNLIRRLVHKGYIEVKASNNQYGLNTYIVKLPPDIINQLKIAPKRGEKGELHESRATQKIEKSALTSGSKSNILPFQAMIDSRLSSESKLVEERDIDIKHCESGHSATGAWTQHTEGEDTVQPLLININKFKNEINNSNHQPVDNNENIENADALLNQFYLFLEEIKISNPAVKDSPSRRNMLALARFNERDRQVICELLLKQKNEDTRSTAIKSSIDNTLKREERNEIKNKQLIEIKIENQSFLVEKNLHQVAIEMLTHYYNMGKIKGSAAQKTLSQIIAEVLFSMCAGDNQKLTQNQKYNRAIHLLSAGKWETPHYYDRCDVLLREQKSAYEKDLEIKQAKEAFSELRA